MSSLSVIPSRENFVMLGDFNAWVDSRARWMNGGM